MSRLVLYSEPGKGEGGSSVTDTEEVEISRLSRCWLNTWRGITFLFSHVGLVSLVTGYCFLGAIAFEQLEKEYELQVKRNMTKTRKDLGMNIWTFTNNSVFLHKENWTGNVTVMIKEFEKNILTAMRSNGWNGSEDPEKRKWTLAGSLFYSIILISTIGYGDQTPKTQWGKIVTVIYAIIGIPLFMICLSNIGDTMANMFRVGSITAEDIISFTVSNYDAMDMGEVNHIRETRDLGLDKRFESELPQLEPIVMNAQESVIDNEDQDNLKSHHPGIVRKNSTRESRKSNHSSKSLTLPIKPMPTVIARKNDDTSSSSCDLSKVSTPTRGAGSMVATPSTPTRTTRLTGGEFFHEFEYEDWEEIDVTKPIPIWISFLLLISYLCLGAFLYSGFEKGKLDDYFNAWHFCFISLTTIGFGDYVPKNNRLNQKAMEELGVSPEYAGLVSILINSLYLMFGMALIATTFSLLGEEVKDKVKNVATKLGLRKEEHQDFME